MLRRHTSIFGLARDNPLAVATLSAGLGFLIGRLVGSGSRPRRPARPDYAVAGRAGVYDPSDEESDGYLGAPDADQGRLERVRASIQAVREYREGLVFKAKTSLARIGVARVG